MRALFIQAVVALCLICLPALAWAQQAPAAGETVGGVALVATAIGIILRGLRAALPDAPWVKAVLPLAAMALGLLAAIVPGLIAGPDFAVRLVPGLSAGAAAAWGYDQLKGIKAAVRPPAKPA